MQLDGNTPLNLQLTVDTTNVVLAALSTQPYERVAGVIATIQQQARTQIEAAQMPASVATTGTEPASAA